MKLCKLRSTYELMRGTLKLTVHSGDRVASSKSSGDDLHDDWEWICTGNVMMIACTIYYTCRRSLCFSHIYCNVSRTALSPTRVIFTLVVVAGDRTFWSCVAA